MSQSLILRWLILRLWRTKSTQRKPQTFDKYVILNMNYIKTYKSGQRKLDYLEETADLRQVYYSKHELHVHENLQEWSQHYDWHQLFPGVKCLDECVEKTGVLRGNHQPSASILYLSWITGTWKLTRMITTLWLTLAVSWREVFGWKERTWLENKWKSWYMTDIKMTEVAWIWQWQKQ